MSVVQQGRGMRRGLARVGRSVLDGRAIVLGCVALYSAAVAAARSVWQVDIWPWLGVPSGPSLFFDALNVAAAAECRRMGYDPLVDNPCDPWGRTIFYPRPWLALRWTGLDQSHTLLFGAVVLALAGLALLALLPRLTVPEGLLVAAAACSPAVMFAVERANMDLVIFAGLALAAVVWRRGSATAQYVALGLVLLMAVAKLYPVVALLAFLPARRRRVAAAVAGALAIFAVYAVLTREDIATISGVATQGQYNSYGARILLGRLYHGLVGDNWAGSRTVAQALVLLAVAVVGVVLWLALRRRRPVRSQQAPRPPLDETAELIAFRMGALVYIGTFVAGNSFDYRLVCLLLVLPGLLRWPAGEGTERAPTFPQATLGIVLLMVWIGALSEPLMLWDELVSWGLAGMLAALLVRSVPSISTVLQPGRRGAPNPGVRELHLLERAAGRRRAWHRDPAVPSRGVGRASRGAPGPDEEDVG